MCGAANGSQQRASYDPRLLPHARLLQPILLLPMCTHIRVEIDDVVRLVTALVHDQHRVALVGHQLRGVHAVQVCVLSNRLYRSSIDVVTDDTIQTLTEGGCAASVTSDSERLVDARTHTHDTHSC